MCPLWNYDHSSLLYIHREALFGEHVELRERWDIARLRQKLLKSAAKLIEKAFKQEWSENVTS